MIEKPYVMAMSAFFMLFGTTYAQDAKLTVQAIDGRNSKPLPSQRLLVFMGESQEDVGSHKQSLDVTTDKNGLAMLQIDQTNIHWIQVFVDCRMLCQTEPNLRSFNVGQIVSSGLATPNNCGSLRPVAAPAHLVVFARPATLREKMAW